MPTVYSIAAHRGFADALVAGLLPRYREDGFGLARLTLLLPSTRTLRTVTEAFVRASGTGGNAGLLLPRMVVVGDLDLDETLGPLLDPLGAGTGIPRAADPVQRVLRLAARLGEELGDKAPGEAALLRQARMIAQTMDRMAVEDVPAGQLLDPEVIGLVHDLSEHWQQSTVLFARILTYWQAELAARGELDPPQRRNRLLEHVAQRWQAQPPPHAVVAAGVTSAAPAVARLLRTVACMPQGAVILPDLDLALADDVWEALGSAGISHEPGGPVFGRGDAVTHPQYHLKLLLNRMGIARGEVQPWHRSGLSAAPPARARAISNLFLPPAASTIWATLPAEDRRMAGVRVMETAHPGEEAQAIAVLVRAALAVPERRVAVVTPDRALAQRLVAHLARWNIAADDTAGKPLPLTAAGRLLLQLADVWAQSVAPVPLLALLGHPLVKGAGARADWLERVRQLDLALRGPRPGPGLEAVRSAVEGKLKAWPGLADWWREVETLIAPIAPGIDRAPARLPLGEALERLTLVAEALCGEAIWAQADGRALSVWIEQWSSAAGEVGLAIDPRELPALLRDAMDEVAVRPPYGGHPRLAIYGLLEARMSRADLVICGGMTEGSWPAAPAPDPLLAPPVLRALGIPGADFRIGLAAHDLAAALGAPEVVLSYAARDAAGPVIPSRFVLRLRAMLGEQVRMEQDAVSFARALDRAAAAPPYPQPMPMPSAAQRRVGISVTGLDRLRGDPYQFYASSILRLSALDPLDADPTPAWRGIAVHNVLDAWHKAGAAPGALIPLANGMLDALSAHPFMRGLWRPRLIAALDWIEEHSATLRYQGRTVLGSELQGDIRIDGITIHGRADRIDRKADGSLAVVDYKTGSPPSAKQVENGFALQLGLLALMAERGGFTGIAGTASGFEYWSLGKRKKGDGFGEMIEPVLEGTKKKTGLKREEFVPETEGYLREAIARWILGAEPFTARLNPDLAVYSDYDQLMRLDEWQGRAAREAQP
ncbi:double-strand break repair protein AddB [Novosphingobium sp. Chol11]|uniref:double-strand break repair protein AddB n=1 Tax=Novosphingobium sp. Chol11 TaxID=1385763 RepID=UPI0025E5DC28|nr:double-strand break repair protein AddB [Novosphingobium sp. Chol11]